MYTGSKPAALLNMHGFEAMALEAMADAEWWRPLLVKLSVGESGRLFDFCARHSISMRDTIDRQLAELAAARMPAAGEADRRSFVERMMEAEGERACVGNWVLLPWLRTLAHVLAAEPYAEVITNRNRDKITGEEQQLLRSKRIGVMGLSVGAESAVCVAQEHLCGAMVLADFDQLDLSNMNRVGAGFDELGLRKTTIAARRIARIDPYLEVTVYDRGVTLENVDAFLDGLDLLIEECDGMALKLAVRQRARARRLNVIFAADERGFLSVEPYADWPELEPFHGKVTRPQPAASAFATPLDYYRALCEWMGGWERISERSRASLARVGDTLCGYPQLASEARFAAGQLGHVARRLLLGEPLAPYVGNLDLDELLPTR